jgi:hypothetical protein
MKAEHFQVKLRPPPEILNNSFYFEKEWEEYQIDI